MIAAAAEGRPKPKGARSKPVRVETCADVCHSSHRRGNDARGRDRRFDSGERNSVFTCFWARFWCHQKDPCGKRAGSVRNWDPQVSGAAALLGCTHHDVAGAQTTTDSLISRHAGSVQPHVKGDMNSGSLRRMAGSNKPLPLTMHDRL